MSKLSHHPSAQPFAFNNKDSHMFSKLPINSKKQGLSSLTPKNANLLYLNQKKTPKNFGLPKKAKKKDILDENPSSDDQISPISSSSSSYSNRSPSITPKRQIFSVNGNLYAVLSQIGSGGSSIVYKVINTQQKLFALKKVNLAIEGVQCLKNEITLLNSLQDSDLIIKLIDYQFDEPNQTLLIVLELGEIPLSKLISSLPPKPIETPKTPKRVLSSSIVTSGIDSNFIRLIWFQMIHAVKVVHDHGVVHGDLKSQNFMFVQGDLKLIDFGISKTLNDKTSITSPDRGPGTLIYMAPEMLKPQMIENPQNDNNQMRYKVGKPADVWSLGCILYHLVYGQSPFPLNNYFMTIQAITDDNFIIEFPPTGRCDNDILIDMMRHCLDRNTKTRATIEELINHPYLTFRPITLEKDFVDFADDIQRLIDNIPDLDFNQPLERKYINLIADNLLAKQPISKVAQSPSGMELYQEMLDRNL